MSGLSDDEVHQSIRPQGNVEVHGDPIRVIKPVVILMEDAEVVHGVLIEAVKRHGGSVEGLEDLYSWDDPGDCLHALVNVLTGDISA